MTQDTQVQILCNENDKNKDIIVHRMALLHEAVSEGNIVAIAVKDEKAKEDAIVLAVVTQDDGGEFVHYSPIGQLYYPDDTSFERYTPPEASISADKESDVKH